MDGHVRVVHVPNERVEFHVSVLLLETHDTVAGSDAFRAVRMPREIVHGAFDSLVFVWSQATFKELHGLDFHFLDIVLGLLVFEILLVHVDLVIPGQPTC